MDFGCLHYTEGDVRFEAISSDRAEDWCIAQRYNVLCTCRRFFGVHICTLQIAQILMSANVWSESWCGLIAYRNERKRRRLICLMYDAKNYLAVSYKFYSKVTYVGLLFLSVLAVLISILPPDVFSSLEEADTKTPAFFVTLMAASAASVSALANPTQRWRVLRSNAVFLSSIIWQYRTRAKAFGIANMRQKPQQTLCQRVQQWKAELAVGTSLLESTMGKVYPESIYKHFVEANPSQALKEDQDDFYSPVPPAKYVTLRLVPAVAFYQSRIPSVGRRRGIMQLSIVLCLLPH